MLIEQRSLHERQGRRVLRWPNGLVRPPPRQPCRSASSLTRCRIARPRTGRATYDTLRAAVLAAQSLACCMASMSACGEGRAVASARPGPGRMKYLPSRCRRRRRRCASPLLPSRVAHVPSSETPCLHLSLPSLARPKRSRPVGPADPRASLCMIRGGPIRCRRPSRTAAAPQARRDPVHARVAAACLGSLAGREMRVSLRGSWLLSVPPGLNCEMEL